MMERVHDVVQVDVLTQQLKTAITGKDVQWIQKTLTAQNAVELASIFVILDLESIHFVLKHLSLELSAKILSNMEHEQQKVVLEQEKPKIIASYLEFFESDDAADLLDILPRETRDKVLFHIKDLNHAMGIEELLHYDEDSAGGLMAKELVKVNVDWTIGQCNAEIYRQAKKVRQLIIIYVVDDDNVLKGTLSTKQLILEDPSTSVKDIIIEEGHFIESYADEKEVVDIMEKYDLNAIPVVNSRKQLLGRITIDDIIDVIQDNAEESIQMMSGISEDVEQTDTVFRIVRARLPWLVVGIFGGLLSAYLLEGWGSALDLRLTFFIPLIMATGGNVGVQSSSLTIQSLASEQHLQINIGKRLLKMIVVSIVNGLVLAVLVFIGTSIFMDTDYFLGIVVAISLIVIVLLASLMGTVTPLILNRFNINPALASGPFISTTNDLIGLLVFLWLGSYMLATA